MKKLFLAAALLFAACVAPVSAATVTLDLVSPADASGNFTLAVNVTDLFANFPGDTFTGYGLNIAISDPAKAQLAGFTVDPAFDDYSFLLPSPSSILAFSIPPAGYTQADLGSGVVTLAMLQFTGLTAGSVDVTVSSDPLDLNTGLMFTTGGYEQFSSSATVGAVPEPTTFALAGTALLGLAALARRRRK